MTTTTIPSPILSQRLIAVKRHLSDAIDHALPGVVRIISACAGQGHDVIGVVATHPRWADVQALLVESDDHNVRVARDRIAAAGITGVDVVQADAGVTGTYREAVPADVLMLCGIFGNLSDEDVQSTVAMPRGSVRLVRRCCGHVTGGTPIEPRESELGSPRRATRSSLSTRLGRIDSP